MLFHIYLTKRQVGMGQRWFACVRGVISKYVECMYSYIHVTLCGSTSKWRTIALDSGNMFYTVLIISKRDFMSIYNYMCKHVDCGDVGKVIDCALIMDGRYYFIRPVHG